MTMYSNGARNRVCVRAYLALVVAAGLAVLVVVRRPPPAIAWVAVLPSSVPVLVGDAEVAVALALAEGLAATLLLLPLVTVPPTAPPTTAPMTTRTTRTMVMMPLRVRQNDVCGLGAEGGYVGARNFSPEPFSAASCINGTVTGAGAAWSACGGGLRVEGVRRGGCSNRSTLYPSWNAIRA